MEQKEGEDAEKYLDKQRSVEMLNRLGVDDSSGFGGSVDISSEVEMETLVKKNGDNVIAVNRLDESIDREVADMHIVICQTRKKPRLL